ncbi:MULTISPECIES: RusA family crossover junction endodeoxyribonuclease [unclassified Aureimonas]|uniref:RusA family crossover junction endodeoxyribonuclease n=1 Tax=unclassified Aureimonas TaxID=2615206 RepID=UPI000701D33C|nr:MULTISPECIES: RusA family crossover junction endodeoxyribonuclease [unclassified Aureimonas]KQT52256.1 hypothetical protein ASG62_16505 [Aureimonas sp. Leaf427]KQT65740.1 hypothetical protein ASG54_22555 [Aureimonas sp. Leaf460]
MTSIVRITMPFPPSLNGVFPTRGNRRVPSPAYRAWRDEAGWTIKAQRPAKFTTPVHVRIDLMPPDGRRRDVDNLAKAPLDALVAAGVLADDSLVRRLSIGWVEIGEPCVVIVSPWESAQG